VLLLFLGCREGRSDNVSSLVCVLLIDPLPNFLFLKKSRAKLFLSAVSVENQGLGGLAAWQEGLSLSPLSFVS